MSDTVDPSKPVSRQNAARDKAATTTRVANQIIDAEAQRRRVKTDRLKALRLEQEASALAAAPVKKTAARKRAKPAEKTASRTAPKAARGA